MVQLYFCFGEGGFTKYEKSYFCVQIHCNLSKTKEIFYLPALTIELVIQAIAENIESFKCLFHMNANFHGFY